MYKCVNQLKLVILQIGNNKENILLLFFYYLFKKINTKQNLLHILSLFKNLAYFIYNFL